MIETFLGAMDRVMNCSPIGRLDSVSSSRSRPIAVGGEKPLVKGPQVTSLT